MNKKSLIIALLMSGAVLGSIGQNSAIWAQEIESTAPGETYQDIPEIEPAPIDSTSSSDSTFGSQDFESQDFGSQDDFESTSSASSQSSSSVEIEDPSSLNKSEKKVAKAMRTFEEFMIDPDTKIPSDLLRQSEGIVILPDIIQAGFFLGGRGGTGILALRNDDGSWSNPAFVKITGGSLGLQFGAKSSDLVLIFPKRTMVYEALTGSYNLGGSVSGTAGSIGKNPVDSTRRYSKEKIYAYSRSNGLYGGISLEGSELNFNKQLNRQFYGQNLSPREIFSTSYRSVPSIASSLSNLLTQAESGNFRLF